MNNAEIALRAMVLGHVTAALWEAPGLTVTGAAPTRGVLWLEAQGQRYRVALIAEGDAAEPVERKGQSAPGTPQAGAGGRYPWGADTPDTPQS